MTVFDDVSGRSWARHSPAWSDLRGRYCQKCRLGPFILIFSALLVTELCIVINEAPFPSRYMIPFISRNVTGLPENGAVGLPLHRSLANPDNGNDGTVDKTGAIEEMEKQTETENGRREEEENQSNDRVEKDHKEAEEQKADRKRKEEEEQKIAEQKEAEDKKLAEQKELEEKKIAEQKETEDKKLAEQKESEEKKVAEQKEAEERRVKEEKEKAEKEKKRKEEEKRKEKEEQKRAVEEREAKQKSNNETQYRLKPGECDLFDGSWVHDPEGPLYTNETCFYRPSYLDCISNGRPDSGYMYWRWKPRDCDLPRFNAKAFMESFRGKTLGFAGDSLARNQMQSMMCMLAQAEKPQKLLDRNRHSTYFYEQYQVTLKIVWAPYLLQYNENVPCPEINSTIGVLELDVLDTNFTSLLDSDLLVLSVGQWYSKPAVFRRENRVVGCHGQLCESLNYTKLNFFELYAQGLRTALTKVVSEVKGIAILSAFAIQHVEYKPGSRGGLCTWEKPVGEEDVPKFAGLHDRMRPIVLSEFNHMAAERSTFRDDFHLDFIDLRKLSLLRADGHPGPYGHYYPFPKKDPSEWFNGDCLHYCLPGPIDTWNEVLLKIAGKYL